MRKIVTFIVVITMMLALASCGKTAAPTDSFVMERLKTIGTISDMAAVTEDHDPNGQLNKQGGYIGWVATHNLKGRNPSSRGRRG